MTQYLPIGCYGKVPCWPEYLEANVSFPSSRAFKDWIRRGRGRASADTDSGNGQERPESRFLECRRQRFLYGASGSGELVAGTIGPSRDQAGRGNSFSVLTHIPRRYYGKHYGLLPMALAPVWEALEDAWSSMFEAATRSAFDETVQNTLIPAPVPSGTARGQFRARQSEEASRLFAADGASLAALAEGIPKLVEQLRKAPSGVRVELPVSSDPGDSCFDATFWIELINQRFFLRRFEPAVFLGAGPEAEEAIDLLLLFGGLLPEDYLHVMGGGEDSGNTLRPAAAPDPGVPSGEDGESFTFESLLKRRF